MKFWKLASIAATLVCSNNVIADITIDPTNNGSTDVTLSPRFGVGMRYDGAIRIDNGSTFNSSVTEVGYDSGVQGNIAVSGSGTRWRDTGIIAVGIYGEGHVRVDNGGFIGGASSEFQLGSLAGGSGSLLVTDIGSRVDTGLSNIIIGRYGQGSMRVENGGRVETRYGIVGYESTGDGVVVINGNNSSWNLSNSLSVGGYGGNGSVTIENGATITSQRGYIESRGDNSASVLVTGEGSRWVNQVGGLDIGRNGMGSLTIENGGSVSANGLRLGNFLTGQGELNFGIGGQTDLSQAFMEVNGVVALDSVYMGEAELGISISEDSTLAIGDMFNFIDYDSWVGGGDDWVGSSQLFQYRDENSELFYLEDDSILLIDGYGLLLDYNFDLNNGIGEADYAFTATVVSISSVPIPASIWLFGSGLIGLVGFSRRKKT